MLSATKKCSAPLHNRHNRQNPQRRAARLSLCSGRPRQHHMPLPGLTYTAVDERLRGATAAAQPDGKRTASKGAVCAEPTSMLLFSSLCGQITAAAAATAAGAVAGSRGGSRPAAGRSPAAASAAKIMSPSIEPKRHSPRHHIMDACGEISLAVSLSSCAAVRDKCGCNEQSAHPRGRHPGAGREAGGRHARPRREAALRRAACTRADAVSTECHIPLLMVDCHAVMLKSPHGSTPGLQVC